MNAEVWDWLRWVNAGLASVVVLLLVMGAVARWDHLPQRLKRIVPWVLLTYVIIAYGSGEVAASDEHIDPGLRVFLMSLNLCGLLVALLYRMRDRDYSE